MSTLLAHASGVLNDVEIVRECSVVPAMIWPFVGHQVRMVDGGKVISFGLSSAGYDIRLGNEFARIVGNSQGALDRFNRVGIIDPKNFDAKSLLRSTVESGPYIIPGHEYVLAKTVEMFNIPRNIQATCLTKSTYARSGIVVNVTPLEPGWSGYLTLEIFNATPCAVYLYPGEGIAQLVFNYISTPVISYADRKGKYQDQPNEIVLSKV
jgi:dCTP deaminase